MADLKTEGKFDRARGRIRETWGDVTDDDVDRAQGNVEQLVGTIKEKTGESVDAVREKLDRIFADEPNETR